MVDWFAVVGVVRVSFYMIGRGNLSIVWIFKKIMVKYIVIRKLYIFMILINFL